MSVIREINKHIIDNNIEGLDKIMYKHQCFLYDIIDMSIINKKLDVFRHMTNIYIKDIKNHEMSMFLRTSSGYNFPEATIYILSKFYNMLTRESIRLSFRSSVYFNHYNIVRYIIVNLNFSLSEDDTYHCLENSKYNKNYKIYDFINTYLLIGQNRFYRTVYNTLIVS